MEQNIEIKEAALSGNEPKMVTRHFGGETKFTLDYSSPENLQKSKDIRHFHQRMLRAYLKGKDIFHFGRHYEPSKNRYLPTPHEVLVNYF